MDHKDYLKQIGSLGGSTKGYTKRRGNSEYYKTLARKSVKARKKAVDKRKPVA